jgi:Fe2+ transport system protein FeoA
LLDIPTDIVCRIEWAGQAVKDAGHFVMMGVRPGGFARVLARHPEHDPLFVELEVDRGRITLPANLACQVLVSPF